MGLGKFFKKFEKQVIRPTVGGGGLGGVLIPHKETRNVVGKALVSAAVGGSVGAGLATAGLAGGATVMQGAAYNAIASGASSVATKGFAFQATAKIPIGKKTKKKTTKPKSPKKETKERSSSSARTTTKRRLQEAAGSNEEKAAKRQKAEMPTLATEVVPPHWPGTSFSKADLGSLVLDLAPVVGSMKAAYEIVTGKDVVTNEKVDRLVAAVSVVAALLPGGKAAIKGGVKAVKSVKHINPHIFREAKGHVNPASDASKLRFHKLFENVAKDKKNRDDNRIGRMARENRVQGYFKKYREGEVWVHVRDGKIQNAGVNK